MIQAVSVLFAVALLSFLFKDRVLMASAIVLLVIAATDFKPLFGLLQKGAFQIGIFFLMIFILLPIATGKISFIDSGRRLLGVEGALAVLAGIGISYIGGKGVGVLSGHPTVLAGVVLGTLIAVLFLDGLPAGLIIAAGLVGLAGKYVG